MAWCSAGQNDEISEKEETLPARPGDGLRSGLRLAAVLVAAGVIFTIPAGRHPLWAPDEARQAVLARDILEQGRWLAPEIRGEPNMHKPPLYRWSVAVASLPAGRVTELTAAIPSLVSALAGVAGVVQIGRLLWGWPAGLLAGLILATTPTYFENSHRVLPDMMLTAWTVWALYWLLRARQAAWTTRPLLAFYGCVGGAILSKGPVGFIALAGAIVAAFATGGLTGLRRLRWPIGVLLLGSLTAVWVATYLLLAPRLFFCDTLVTEYGGWAFRWSFTNRLLHLPTVLLTFLPWSVFLVGAACWWRRAPDDGRNWIMAWTLTLWLVIGLVSLARPHYLLPVYPGGALLAAEFCTIVSERRGRMLVAAASAVAGLVALGVAAIIASPLASVAPIDPIYRPSGAGERGILAVLLVAGALAVWLAAWRGAFWVGAMSMALMMAGVLVVEGVRYPPRYARYYDVREIAAAAAAVTPADGTVVGYPHLGPAYDFYLRRQLIAFKSAPFMTRFLATRSPAALITWADVWAELAPSAGASRRVLATRMVAGHETVVVSGDADPDLHGGSGQELDFLRPPPLPCGGP
jgi:4-amino-4-deoxy-L-arabinose transferase-like glycosyltransferase